MTDWIDPARPGFFKRLAMRWVAKDFNNYVHSTVTSTDNVASRQGKNRDFSPKVAVDNFFSLVYAAAQMNANAVARTPLRLYGRVRKGKTANFQMRKVLARRKQYLLGNVEHRPSPGVVTKVASFGEDFQEIPDHPALDVLRGVNRWQNGFDATVLRILFLELTGNAYVYVRTGSLQRRSFPIEFWPMPSQWVKVIPSQDPEHPIISGYVYGRTEAEAFTYDPEEVIRWNYPNPRNLYYGLGKVEAAWREICLRNSKAGHDQAIFDNGARPDYAVLLKGAPKDETKRFQTELEQRLRGVKNRGKFAVVNAEQVDIKPLTFDNQQLGDQDRVIEAICNVFGVPVSKFMSNKSVAGGQAGVSDVSYLRDTVLPICRMDEETLNSDYLPRFQGAADDLVLAYDNPIPEDREAQRADDTMRLSQGVITHDEWRVENGYDAHGGKAAELMVPNNLVAIEDAGKPMTPLVQPDSMEGDIEALADERTKTQLEAVTKAVEELASVVKGLDKPLRVTEYEVLRPNKEPIGKAITPPSQSEADRKRHRDEAALLLLLLGFWAAQKEEILSTVDPKDHKPITPNPSWDAQLSAALLGGMLPIGFREAQSSLEDIGATGLSRQANTEVQEQLQEVADRLAPLINQTTVDRVNSAMAGVTPGADNADDLLRTAIGQVFDDAEEGRGPLIAGDTAFIAGQAGTVAPGIVANEAEEVPEDTPEELPESPPETPATPVPPKLVATAEWVTAEDDRVCATCSPLDGRVVIAGDEFAPGINLPTVDTHPGCRCVIRLGTKPANYPDQPRMTEDSDDS